MSILRYKQKLLPYGNPMGGSGGGGGGPTSSRVEQTNIPEYARPYVETMLGATQQQLFNTRQIGATPDVTRQIGTDENGRPIMETTPGTPGYTEITGIKPYVPYSSNPSDYVAGFTPMQQEAFKRMAQQQVAPQIGQATTQAQGIAPQAYGYGSMGAGMGLEATGAGQAYQRAATTPGDVAAYMSPYMQNVVDYQKQQAIRDFQKQAPMMQAQAVGQGAFGGNRLALQQGEANRALQNQLAGIQATGTQSAFDQARQAQQFRANLGLQGLQTGMQGVGLGLQGVGLATQGAGLLGSLGQTQYGQETGITENILRAGTMQQQLEQQKINQAISDYATAQQYPQQQLSFMNAMLRGLPTQQSTVQGYQAAPSAISQIGGLSATGVGLYGMGKTAGMFKEGGVVKMAGGGITGLSKDVLLNPEKYSIDQISNMTKKGMISDLIGIPILDAKKKEQERLKLAQAAQQPRPVGTLADNVRAAAGIDNAQSNLPVMSAFDGGIVAMADGGEVERFFDGGTMAGFGDVPTTGGVEPEEYTIDPLTGQKLFSGYGRSKSAATPAAPAPKKDTGIRILPDAKPSRPAMGTAAPPPPAAPEMDMSGKGITDILKKFEERQAKSEAKDVEDKKMAFWSSLAELGAGMMAGTSPYAATNIGQAGLPAIKSGMGALREIRGREEKRGLADLQASLEGEKIKADYAKLGMLQPYYGAMTDYYKRRPAGGASTAGLGSVTPAVADKVMTRFQGYEAQPTSAPFFGQLPPKVQEGLSGKYGPKTESYRRSMEVFRQYNDRAMQQYLNSLRGYAAKTAVTADEI